MASGLYAKGIVALGNGSIDFDTDNLRLALLGDGYTADLNAHDAFDDVNSYEISGAGYTATGQTVASCTVTSSSNVITFTGANCTWTTATISARYGVLYCYKGSTASDNPLLALFDFGSTQTSSSGTFNVAWSTGGIFTITVNAA